MADTFSPKFGPTVALHFQASNIDTGASGTNTFGILPGTTNTLAVMPAAGSVVALAVKANGNVTTGTAAFNVHKAGTAYSQVSSLLTTLTTASGSSNVGYNTVRAGVLTFVAGDQIGVNYATATNYAATTVDFDAILYVTLNPG